MSETLFLFLWYKVVLSCFLKYFSPFYLVWQVLFKWFLISDDILDLTGLAVIQPVCSYSETEHGFLDGFNKEVQLLFQVGLDIPFS